MTDEEKKYNLDNDDVLSITEKAAYLQAQAQQKTLEGSGTKSTSDSIDISSQALGMLQNPLQPPPAAQQIHNVNDLSDDDLKSVLSHMGGKHSQLPKELSSTTT